MGNNPSGFPYELGEKFSSIPQTITVSGLSRWEGPFCEDGWDCYRGYPKNHSTSNSSSSTTNTHAKKGEGESTQGNSTAYVHGLKKDSLDLSSSSSSANQNSMEVIDDNYMHQVTIFKTDKGSGKTKLPPSVLECNLHHYNRIKTLKHPCILKYIDGIELEKEILLVTEPVVPLSIWLQKRLKELEDTADPIHSKQIYQNLEDEIAWGFRCILKALSFLHDSYQKYCHCNISPNAIFVTRSGDWRLGSFQLLCEWKEYGDFVQHYANNINAQSMWMNEKYFSPERRTSSYNVRNLVKDTKPGDIDVFALGELIDDIFSTMMKTYDIVNNTNFQSNAYGKQRREDRNKVNKLSSSLAAILKRMKDPVANNRPTCTAILNQSYFKRKPLSTILDFLETLSLKDEGEVMHFFESQLMPIISRSNEKIQFHFNGQKATSSDNQASFSNNSKIGDEIDNTLPYNICTFKIFPLLRNYLHLDLNATNGDMIQNLPTSGKGKDNGNTSSIPNSPSLIKALPILMNLFCMAYPRDFTILMENSVCRLFAMNDRAVRSSLLYALPNIANKISTENINMRIFEATLFGLNDSLLAMREATLKGLVSLTDKLNDKNLNEKLIKSLSRLQSDPEPALRCNTTIFLGKIASQIKEGVRNRILLPSILKGFRDNFPHSRLASLKAMIACLTYMDEVTICQQVLPCLSLLLIDPDSMVRDQAFVALSALTQKLSLYGEVLRQEENKRKEEAALRAQEQQQQQLLQQDQGGFSQQPQGMPKSKSVSSHSSPVKQVVSSTAKSATSTANSLATWAVQKLVNVDPQSSDSPTSVVNSTSRPSQQPPPPPGPPPSQSRNSVGNTRANIDSNFNSKTNYSNNPSVRNSGRSIEKEKEKERTNNGSRSKGMKLGSRNTDEQNLDKGIKKLSLSSDKGSGDGWDDDDDFFGDESNSTSLSTANSITSSPGKTMSATVKQNNSNYSSSSPSSIPPKKISLNETKIKDGWDDFDDENLGLPVSRSGSHDGKQKSGIKSTIMKNPSLHLEDKKQSITSSIASKSSSDINSINIGSTKVSKVSKPQRVKAQKLKIEDDDWDDF